MPALTLSRPAWISPFVTWMISSAEWVCDAVVRGSAAWFHSSVTLQVGQVESAWNTTRTPSASTAAMPSRSVTWTMWPGAAGAPSSPSVTGPGSHGPKWTSSVCWVARTLVDTPASISTVPPDPHVRPSSTVSEPRST